MENFFIQNILYFTDTILMEFDPPPQKKKKKKKISKIFGFEVMYGTKNLVSDPE